MSGQQTGSTEASLTHPASQKLKQSTVSEWSPSRGLVGPGHPQREQPDLHSGDLEQGQHSQRAVQGAVPSPRHPEEEVQWKRKFSDQKRTGFQPHSGFPSPGLMPFFFILVSGDDSPLPSSYVSRQFPVAEWGHGDGHMPRLCYKAKVEGFSRYN